MTFTNFGQKAGFYHQIRQKLPKGTTVFQSLSRCLEPAKWHPPDMAHSELFIPYMAEK